MADKFERHRSTRWVNADIPSYGDEWGNEYDESELDHDLETEIGNIGDSEAKQSISSESSRTDAFKNPEINSNQPAHLVSNSTLVLSIDQTNFHAKSDDSDVSATEKDPEENVHPENFKKTVISPSTGPPVANIEAQDKKPQPLSMNQTKDYVYETSDLLPPTPTYSSRPHFVPASPETDVSDRSFMSDADSIQREPANLNVWAPKPHSAAEKYVPARISEDLSSASMSTGERSFIEPPRPKQMPGSPQALVLSIDRLNLGSSDEDEVEDDSSSLENFRPQADHHTDDEKDDSPVSDEDDWGYNSNHSSNFEEQGDSIAQLPHQPHRQRVKTDALDSLIDDLSKMEDDRAFFGESSAQTLETEQPLTTSGNSEYHTTKESAGLLPTLGSIHDLKLPDFNSRSFDGDDAGSSVTEFIPLENNISLGDEEHQKFMSSARQDSMRKPPPPSLSTQLGTQQQNKMGSSVTLPSEVASLGELKADSDQFSQQNESNVKEAPAPTVKASDFAPPPISKDIIAVDRRDSLISTSTFNLGTWKPNTGLFRDQFVNDNDNESQMNVSLFTKDESAYRKFTRMGPVSTYAPSISNSSCVSVPDTVDTSLQKINEDQSDEDYPDTISVAKSYQPVTPLGSSDQSLGSSVLYDHDYKKPKFQEESNTPAVSTDDLDPIREEVEPREAGAGTSDTVKTNIVADSDTTTILPKKVKYPVSNWKSIMAISQPTDRIKLLTKAKTDEINFDTGLSQWLRESLKSAESPHIQIGQLATQAYKNAQHSDIRRHTSIRSKVNLVRDKIEPGHLSMQASSLGRKFLSRGKKLMKQSSD